MKRLPTRRKRNNIREVCDCLEIFIAHIPDERLIRLQHGLSEALKCFTDDSDQLSEVAGWLIHILMLLDSDENPSRTGDEVEKELVEYLDQLLEETISAFSSVDMDVFREERQRLRNHRARFKLHTRSGKKVRTELEKLTARWLELPQENQKR